MFYIIVLLVLILLAIVCSIPTSNQFIEPYESQFDLDEIKARMKKRAKDIRNSSSDVDNYID